SSTSWHARACSSAQLAVLAAAPVVAAVFLFVALFGFLAGDAQPYPGHGLPARLRNRRIALLATQARRPLRQLAARTLDAVLHGRVDLVLHRAVTRPARGHHVLHRPHNADTACLPHPAFRSRRAS